MHVRFLEMLVQFVVAEIDIVGVRGLVDEGRVVHAGRVPAGLSFAQVVNEGVVARDSAVREAQLVLGGPVGACVLVHEAPGLRVDPGVGRRI